MKRLCIILCFLLLCFTMTACSNKDEIEDLNMPTSEDYQRFIAAAEYSFKKQFDKTGYDITGDSTLEAFYEYFKNTHPSNAFYYHFILNDLINDIAYNMIDSLKDNKVTKEQLDSIIDHGEVLFEMIGTFDFEKNDVVKYLVSTGVTSRQFLSIVCDLMLVMDDVTINSINNLGYKNDEEWSIYHKDLLEEFEDLFSHETMTYVKKLCGKKNEIRIICDTLFDPSIKYKTRISNKLKEDGKDANKSDYNDMVNENLAIYNECFNNIDKDEIKNGLSTYYDLEEFITNEQPANTIDLDTKVDEIMISIELRREYYKFLCDTNFIDDGFKLYNDYLYFSNIASNEQRGSYNELLAKYNAFNFNRTIFSSYFTSKLLEDESLSKKIIPFIDNLEDYKRVVNSTKQIPFFESLTNDEVNKSEYSCIIEYHNSTPIILLKIFIVSI